MYPKYYILLLGLFLLGDSLSAKSYNDQTGLANNERSDDFYLDDEQREDWPNDDYGDDDDDASGSGMEEGSADGGALTLCMTVREQLRQKHIDAYIPRCTDAGEFESLQCNYQTGECWCVTRNGNKIPNTVRRPPHKPTCDGVDRGQPVVPDRKPPKAKPTAPEESSEEETDDNDINIDQATDGIDMAPAPGEGTGTNIPNKIDPIPEIIKTDDMDQSMGASASNPESEPMQGRSFVSEPGILADSGSPVEIIPPGSDSDRTSAEFSESQARSLERSPIIAQPGILAGIIGGAVVGLLCAVLLVMFIVYRMRKKDEGSYALDEPKRSPSLGYTKARDREFFA